MSLRLRVHLLSGDPKWFTNPEHAKTFLLAQRRSHPDSDGCLWVEQGTHDTLLGYVDSDGEWVRRNLPRGPGRPRKKPKKPKGHPVTEAPS